MGRAMLIICSGMLISLGIISMSTSNQGRLLVEKTVSYADFTMAKNAAHTAIQMAMQEINQDDDWAVTHDSSNPWQQVISDRQVELFVDYIHQDPDYWEPDSIRVVSRAFFEDRSVVVSSLYLKAPFSTLVPEFESPLTIATPNFNLSTGGSASINGNVPSGSDCPEDKPGITVLTEAMREGVVQETHNIDVQGNPSVKPNSSLSYQPTDELIERLANTNGVQFISGNYKGSMGTQESPGVFFIEENARLTGGIDDGYGILVIRTNGAMEYEGEDGTTLNVAGNFTFNGLVIFENAYNLQGNGTPTINGSVLIGNTPDFLDTININLSGNLHLQYDCAGENYAKMAAANAVQQNKYSRIVTSEGYSLVN